MNATAKAQMLARVAPDIEPVGVIEEAGIAIGSTDQCQDFLAGVDGFSTDLGFGQRRAISGDERAFEPQCLIDRGCRAIARIGHQRCPLLPVLRKGENAIAQHVGGGFKACTEQTYGNGHELLVRECIFLSAGLDERGSKVVLGIYHPISKELFEECLQHADLLVGLRQFLLGQRARFEHDKTACDRIHDLGQARIARVDPEHVAHDPHG